MPIAPLLLAALVAPQINVTDGPAGGLGLLSVQGPPGTRCQASAGGRSAAPLPLPGTVSPPEGAAVQLDCTLPDGSQVARAVEVPPGVHRRVRLATGPSPSAEAVGIPNDALEALLAGLSKAPDRRSRQVRLLAVEDPAGLTVDQLDRVLGALPLPAERRWAVARFGPGLVDGAAAHRLARRFALAADRAWLAATAAAWAQRTE
ncbi:MAG: hypothetical protein H6702_21450 [Myxococcales bacterium]|nr:hypothetical protein [Myxococcales bacterium]